jgi:ATP-dependent protease HslVU (ClpYQ) peptidase subunit
MEVSFFLDEKALIGLAGPSSSAACLLESFDQNRERILNTARKVYERRRKGSYDLFASDFR